MFPDMVEMVKCVYSQKDKTFKSDRTYQ